MFVVRGQVQVLLEARGFGFLGTWITDNLGHLTDLGAGNRACSNSLRRSFQPPFKKKNPKTYVLAFLFGK